MPIDLAIVGATGRTGQHVLRAAIEASDIRPVAALCSSRGAHLGKDVGEFLGRAHHGLRIADQLGALEIGVLVDFSTPAGTRQWLAECVRRGIPMVIGTTGHTPQDLLLVEEAARRIPILVAPNLAPGVALLRAAVEEVSRRMHSLGLRPDIEILDLHHRHKRDAPSGTALALAQDVVSGQRPTQTGPGLAEDPREPTPEEPREITGPNVHSLRLGGRAGDHAVHFGLPDETLSLSHSVHSRRVFARGALLAARWLKGRTPGQYDMRSVLLESPDPRRPSDGSEFDPSGSGAAAKA